MQMVAPVQPHPGGSGYQPSKRIVVCCDGMPLSLFTSTIRFWVANDLSVYGLVMLCHVGIQCRD
jgi:hypothetical protein